jgi:hypothetical protein
MRVLLAIIWGFVCLAAAVAQGFPPVSQDDRKQDDLERRMSNMGLSGKIAGQEAAEARRETIMKRSYPPKMDERFQERITIEQSLNDFYEKNLRNSGWGIVKLISPVDCSLVKTESRLGNCLQENANILEFANAFSFRESKRNVFARSDLALAGDFLVTGRHSVQTIIVSLGDTPIESLTIDSPGITHLASFRPSTQEKDIDGEFQLYKNGLTVASFETGSEIKHSFGKVSKVIENTTYAVRSVAYRPVNAEPLGKDKDIITVFRIVKKYEDGAITILWRELARNDGLVMVNNDE